MIEKNSAYKSEKWLSAVRSLEYCVGCGAYGVQAAHRNEGKWMGSKVSDCLTAALCTSCHSAIDQGKDMTIAERRAAIDRAIVLTLERLVKAGKVSVTSR